MSMSIKKISLINSIITVICLFVLSACTIKTLDYSLQNEIVMREGTSITVINAYGTLIISAGEGLKRSYTWAGDTRSAKMRPRKERWNGSLGIYYPGDNTWKEHDGVSRAVLEEGILDFESEQALLAYIDKYSDKDSLVYNDEGLFVSWNKFKGAGGTLSVLVWQLMINGKKPITLPGSNNNRIWSGT